VDAPKQNTKNNRNIRIVSLSSELVLFQLLKDFNDSLFAVVFYIVIKAFNYD